MCILKVQLPGLHIYFQTELSAEIIENTQPPFSSFDKPDSQPRQLAFCSLSGTKLSPILNINTNNKPLFPWVLCDSSKLLLFTSCALFGGGAYWKATAHSAQQHNTLEPLTAATQTSGRKDLFVRENKWSNCAKCLPVPWCEEIMTGVSERKRTIERTSLIVLSHVRGL